MRKVHSFAGSEDLGQAAATFFIETAQNAVELRDRFVVALSGGSSPRHLFQILVDQQYQPLVAWNKTYIFWNDERAVAPDHEWSNYKLADDVLLSRVPIPRSNIFRIRGEWGAPQAAEDMRHQMVNFFGKERIPCFDLVLLGMGEDGHTASLFPDTDTLTRSEWIVPVINPPASPSVDRVTLTFPVLNAARAALFLVMGESKQEVFHEIMNDPEKSAAYPAARVAAEQTIWYVDKTVLDSLR